MAEKRGHGCKIVYGLLCAPDGACPVAIRKVFEGNTAIRRRWRRRSRQSSSRRFGLSHVVLVGDRGMITEARIKPKGHQKIRKV